MSFKDKDILITGGSGGLGALICKQLAAEGARVTVLDRLESNVAGQTLRHDLGSAAGIEAAAADIGRRIPPTLYGANIEWRWNATSLWREATQDVDPTALSLTRDMGLRLLRYPGGVYSDFYHWRDGVGPREKRPLVVHEAGKPDKSRANFGTDEALEFADRVGAERLITVNAGSGTAEEAADWVRYVNRDRLRVRYWEIGNEIYLNDGSPATAAVTMPPKKYAQTVLAFARAMRAADPRIVVGAIGGINQGSYRPVSYEDWNATLFRVAGDAFDFLAVHNAYAPILTGDQKGRPLRDVYRAMLARPQHIAANLTRVADEIAAHYPDPAKRPFVAITEWGPIFQFFHEGDAYRPKSDFPEQFGIMSSTDSNIATTEDISPQQLSEVIVMGQGASGANSNFAPPSRKMAAPTGGFNAYNSYLESNMRYPEEARQRNITGRVTIEFTVTAEGMLTGFNIVQVLGYGCDEEVIRLVKEGPAWTPSLQNNTPIESVVRVRLKF